MSEEALRYELSQIADRLEHLEHKAGRAAWKMLARDLIHDFACSVTLQPDDRIDASPANRIRIEILKAFESHHVIYNPRVTTLGYKGKEVLRRLFAVLDQGKDSVGLLPENWGEEYERTLLDGNEPARKRVICDFLANMTDSYAMRFYSRLFVPGQGSFYEVL